MSRSSKSKRVRARSFSAAGPETMEALLSYPSDVLQSLQVGEYGPMRMRALLQNMKALTVTTDYSGMDMVEIAVVMLKQALEAPEFGSTSSLDLCLYRAGDCSEVCRAVLGCDPELLCRPRSEHIFGDLNERLSEDMRSALDGLEPTLQSTQEEKLEAYSNMQTLLMDDASASFSGQSKAPCYKCGQRCLVRPPSDSSRLHLHGAGHSCVAFSPRGKRAGFAHSSARPFHIWGAERRAHNEDIIIAECSSHFPAEVFADVTPRHRVITLVLGPDAIGWPIRRSRNFTILIGEDMVWTGPQTSEECMSLFMELFGRTCMATGDVFLSGPFEAVQAFYQEIMHTRGSYVRASSLQELTQLPWSAFLSPSGVQRLQRYAAMWDQSGTFLVEAAQNPEVAVEVFVRSPPSRQTRVQKSMTSRSRHCPLRRKHLGI